MNEGSCIKKVMDIGQELVTDFLANGNMRIRTTQLPSRCHLVFAKVWDHTEVNACLYDFEVSAEPVLVFGPNVYDPRLPDIDASIWLGFAESARQQFIVAKGLDSIITSSWGRVAHGPGVARARKDTGFISESSPPEPIMPTRPQVTYLTNDQPK